jgi:post-segregation antitoxin (ccd killing protein)
MRMARVNVYLPDDLAAEVRASGLNVSQVTQEALRAALGPMRMDAWLDEVIALGPTGITSSEVVAAVRAAKDELERGHA